MTKNIGTDFDPRPRKRKSSVISSWMFDLLFPIALVGLAVFIGRYGLNLLR
jgi:hypothetical protein